jgi:hypothetical protein
LSSNVLKNSIAKKHGIRTIEDAAHSWGSYYNGHHVGSDSDFTEFTLQAIKHMTSIEGGIITFKNKEDYDKWIARLNAQKIAQNSYNIKYVLEERFAFIETICKLHNIKLHWTFNPTSLSIEVLFENISIFENISDFMKESFVGIPYCRDLLRDQSIGPKTQMEIANKFINPDIWDYAIFCEKAKQNVEWLMNYNNLPK